MFSVSVTPGSDRARDIDAALKSFMEIETLIGVPAEKASRPGEPINNAELLYIHTNGSPIRGIPARPVIEPAIEDAEEELSEGMARAATMAIDGNVGAAKQELARTGMKGQNKARAWFTDSKNGWAPNAPSTIKRKGSDRPLIDTAEMRKAITYVLRKRGR